MSLSSGELEVSDWPELIAPAEMSMDLLSMSSIYTDPRSGRTLRQHRANDMWVASMTFRNMCEWKWRMLGAFMAKIHGPVGRVRLFDYSDRRAQGEAGETGDPLPMLSASAGETEITVNTGALTGPVFLAGDCFSLPNDHRHMVTEDTATGGGLIAVQFEPPLVEAVVHVLGVDEVTVTRPTDIFYLVQRPTLPRDLARLVSVDLQFAQEIRT